jgi:hypothetical protein
MRTILLVFFLILTTNALFAQQSNPVAYTRTITSAGNAVAANSPEQWIIGRWNLITVNGQTTMNGQPLQGYINFTANNLFSGLLFGDQGNGTYSIIYRNGDAVLEAIENGEVSEIDIQTITSTSLVIIVDRVVLEFTK